MKKIIGFVVIIFIITTMTISVFANDLGALSYWYSDSNIIGRWTSSPSVYRI